MLLCCGRRKRKESAEEELSSTLKHAINNFPLEDLRDELLIEILRRLPTAKSAFGFKLVSKRWSFLISAPYFRSQFITHHININKDNCYHAANQFITRSAVFISYHRNKLVFITGKEDPIFESPGFTLEFLPEEREFVAVVAACNDLLLCRARKKGCANHYYVCNPFTMKWLLLPTPLTSYSSEDNNFGLVYEPNYQRWIQGINECRFRVVYIKISGRYRLSIHMYIYCSETRQWNEYPQLGAEYCVSGNIVAHYGKLHWYNDRDAVVAYDPFNNETFFMELFDSREKAYRGERRVTFCLGICQGFLQVMKLVSYTYRGYASDYLSVWELKDPEARSLSLKNRILFSTDSSLVYEPNYCSSSLMSNSLDFHPIAFHPNDKDVVYLQSRDFSTNIITCKIQKGKLEVVGKPLYPWMSGYYRKVFTTVLPWWPTPVPMTPKNSP